MKRKKYKLQIPDAINCQPQQEFTQISNKFLRDDTISSKAKVILSILIGNKQGWKSFVTTLTGFMKESEETIRTGVVELEKLGYVVRLNYRDKKTKQWRGWLWIYTNVPYDFDIELSLVLLDHHGMEIPNLKQRLRRKISPEPNSPELGIPKLGILRTNNINSNNINLTTSSELEDFDVKKASNGYITSKDFFKFKKIYPSKRIGSEGAAITAWDKLCNNKVHRPTWNRVERAIRKQKETPRWKDPTYIPLASTWINQKRWLDDPEQMVAYNIGEPSEEKQRQDKSQHDSEWSRQFGYDKDEE